MKVHLPRTAFVALGALFVAASVSAQTIEDTQTTTFTASVPEQAQVTVPAGVTFNVANVTQNTAAPAATLSATNIVLASATKQLKMSVQANAASFTPSVAGATTWSAGDVSWAAASFTEGGTGASGTLSDSAYNTVVTCGADAASCSTTDLVFTLAAKGTVQRSGDHTLAMTWKVESITP